MWRRGYTPRLPSFRAQDSAGVVLVVAAVAMVLTVRAWLDAATATDKAAVDVDVVHDGQAHAFRIPKDRVIRALVKDKGYAHDLAAGGKG